MVVPATLTLSGIGMVGTTTAEVVLVRLFPAPEVGAGMTPAVTAETALSRAVTALAGSMLIGAVTPAVTVGNVWAGVVSIGALSAGLLMTGANSIPALEAGVTVTEDAALMLTSRTEEISAPLLIGKTMSSALLTGGTSIAPRLKVEASSGGDVLTGASKSSTVLMGTKRSAPALIGANNSFMGASKSVPALKEDIGLRVEAS